MFAKHPTNSSKNIVSDVWGYGLELNGTPSPITYPGPVLVATENQPVSITWKNQLPAKFPFAHPMPDMDVPGMMMRRYSIGHAAVHMHGARVNGNSDGYPMRKAKGGTKTALRPPVWDSAGAMTHPGEEVTYEYPNEQPGGATLWFHDHAMDLTAENVYAGLAGGYLLRHEKEASLTNLPKHPHEVPLIIQDRSFTSDGQLLFGDASYLAGRIDTARRRDRSASRALPPPSPEFKGQAICVNGKLWPVLDNVEPRPYRFRIYNGANSRMFVLRLSSQQQGLDADLAGPPAASIFQIGSDGGIFQRAVELNGQLDAKGQPTTSNFLVLGPGERADVIVDFSSLAGKTVFLTNHATNNSPLGNGGDDVTSLPNLAHVLKFNVNPQPARQKINSLDIDGLNADLDEIQPKAQVLDTLNAKRRRYVIEEFKAPVFFLPEDVDPGSATGTPQPIHPSRNGWKAITIRAVPQSEVMPLANVPGYIWAGKPPSRKETIPPNLADAYRGVPIGIGGMPNGTYAKDPNDLPPAQRGDVEIWEIYNISPDVHPMHLHLVNFMVMSREAIKIDPQAQQIVHDTTKPIRVDANENLGWKDTVRANPLEKITLLVNFDGNSPQGKDYSGDFVWHCHIIDHEDMGMMRPLTVE